MLIRAVLVVCGVLAFSVGAVPSTYLDSIVVADDGFEPAPQPAEATAVYAEPGQTELAKFRQEFLKAVDQEFKAGHVSRFDRLRLRIAANSERGIKQLHRCCAQQAFDDGKIKSFSAIDWEQLLAFIKELLPIILELIKLLSCIDPAEQMLGSELQLVFHDHRSLTAGDRVGSPQAMAS